MNKEESFPSCYDILEWNTWNIVTFLEKEMPDSVNEFHPFYYYKIRGNMLLKLNEEHLKEMGFKIGMRLNLLELFQKIYNNKTI
jgi:hypothetical protein